MRLGFSFLQRNNYPQLKKNSHMPPSPHLLQCVNSQTISYKCRSFCKVSAMFIKIKTLQICEIPHKKEWLEKVVQLWKNAVNAVRDCRGAMIIYHRHKSRGHKFTNPHLRKPRWMHQGCSVVFRSLPSGTFGYRSWDWTIDRLSGVKIWLCDGQYVMASMCLKCSSMSPSGKQKSTDGINMVAHYTQEVSWPHFLETRC